MSGYRASQAELELHFAGSESVLGLRGAPIEPMGGSTSSYGAAGAEHSRRIHFACSDMPLKLRRIGETVAEFHTRAPDDWCVAMVVLSARHWHGLLAREMTRGVRGGNLAGLLVESDTLRALASPGASPLDLLAIAEREAEKTNANAKRRFFTPLRREGEKRFQKALGAYDVLRVARWKREDAAEEARVSRDRAVFA